MKDGTVLRRPGLQLRGVLGNGLPEGFAQGAGLLRFPVLPQGKGPRWGNFRQAAEGNIVVFEVFDEQLPVPARHAEHGQGFVLPVVQDAMPNARRDDDSCHVLRQEGAPPPQPGLRPDGIALDVEHVVYAERAGHRGTKIRDNMPMVRELSPPIPGGDAPGVLVPRRVRIAEEGLLEKKPGEKNGQGAEKAHAQPARRRIRPRRQQQGQEGAAPGGAVGKPPLPQSPEAPIAQVRGGAEKKRAQNQQGGLLPEGPQREPQGNPQPQRQIGAQSRPGGPPDRREKPPRVHGLTGPSWPGPSPVWHPAGQRRPACRSSSCPCRGPPPP